MKTIIVDTIAEELSLNSKRENVTGMISEGKMFYLINGKWEGKEKYESLYPKAIYKKPSKTLGDNLDKRKNFIHDIKSY